MLGPIPLLQWAPEQPILTGYPAVGLLMGELLRGLKPAIETLRVILAARRDLRRATPRPLRSATQGRRWRRQGLLRRPYTTVPRRLPPLTPPKGATRPVPLGARSAVYTSWRPFDKRSCNRRSECVRPRVYALRPNWVGIARGQWDGPSRICEVPFYG